MPPGFSLKFQGVKRAEGVEYRAIRGKQFLVVGIFAEWNLSPRKRSGISGKGKHKVVVVVRILVEVGIDYSFC